MSDEPHWYAHSQKLLTRHRGNVVRISMITERDATGIRYEVKIILREPDDEEGTTEHSIWGGCVEFGQDKPHQAGGFAFVTAARAQQILADQTWSDLVRDTLTTTKPNAKKARDAEEKSAHWLYLGNRARERGEIEKAERHYARSQKHHDEMNRQLGNGDGT